MGDNNLIGQQIVREIHLLNCREIDASHVLVVLLVVVVAAVAGAMMKLLRFCPASALQRRWTILLGLEGGFPRKKPFRCLSPPCWSQFEKGI